VKGDLLGPTDSGVARAIASAFAASATLREAVPRLLEALGLQLRFAAGEYWDVDAGADALRLVMTWRAADVIIPEFEAASRARFCRGGEGLPGGVWSSGKWAIIPDLAVDPNFPRRESAARDQLRSAAAFPLGEAGVLEFFRREEPIYEREIAEIDAAAQPLDGRDSPVAIEIAQIRGHFALGRELHRAHAAEQEERDGKPQDHEQERLTHRCRFDNWALPA